MRKLWVIIAILSIAFIFLHSVIPENNSAAESLWFTDNIINPILNSIGKTANEDFIRKVAHIFEFFVLAIVLFIVYKKPVRVLLFSFCVAFLDESIQILTKRGSLVSDVWIDLIGVTFGLLLCMIINRFFVKQIHTKSS